MQPDFLFWAYLWKIPAYTCSCSQWWLNCLLSELFYYFMIQMNSLLCDVPGIFQTANIVIHYIVIHNEHRIWWKWHNSSSYSVGFKLIYRFWTTSDVFKYIMEKSWKNLQRAQYKPYLTSLICSGDDSFTGEKKWSF